MDQFQSVERRCQHEKKIPFIPKYYLLLILRCGDVSPNPGPVKFCHLNARSLLAGVDLNKHIDDQYSLLDEIHETLIYFQIGLFLIFYLVRRGLPGGIL